MESLPELAQMDAEQLRDLTATLLLQLAERETLITERDAEIAQRNAEISQRNAELSQPTLKLALNKRCLRAATTRSKPSS